MKHINTLLLLFLVVFGSFTLTACSDDEKEDDTNCLVELNKLAQLNYTKVAAYNNDPTPENCEAMKKTATDFFEKAKQCGDEDMIYAAEENLNAINEWSCD